MFKRSLILPALAVLALAACDDNTADQTSTTTDTTVSEMAPATGDSAVTDTITTYTPTTNPETMGGGGGGIPDEQRTATETDAMGNAGPAADMSADEAPAAPNPETFNEETAAETMEDDATCGDHSAWVGQPVDKAALTETGKVYRVMKAGDPMTMDHNPDRINVEQDDAGMVTRVWCG